MAMQVGLTKSGSEAQRLNCSPQETVKVASACAGGTWAKAVGARARKRAVRRSGRVLMGGADSAGGRLGQDGPTDVEYRGAAGGVPMVFGRQRDGIGS